MVATDVRRLLIFAFSWQPHVGCCAFHPNADALVRTPRKVEILDFQAVHSVNAGSFTTWPPFSAESCAHRPTHVQLADWRAFGNGSRFSSIAIKNSCARCGCDPPWPAPCVKLRCVFFARSYTPF